MATYHIMYVPLTLLHNTSGQSPEVKYIQGTLNKHSNLYSYHVPIIFFCLKYCVQYSLKGCLGRLECFYHVYIMESKTIMYIKGTNLNTQTSLVYMLQILLPLYIYYL